MPVFFFDLWAYARVGTSKQLVVGGSSFIASVWLAMRSITFGANPEF